MNCKQTFCLKVFFLFEQETLTKTKSIQISAFVRASVAKISQKIKNRPRKCQFRKIYPVFNRGFIEIL